jgi:hypothetical protein
MNPLTCPYCGGNAPLDDTKKIYSGRDFGLAYICENYPACDAYVGIHKETLRPLGRLANKELRHWKIKAHNYFDELWKRKLIKRKKQKGQKYKKLYGRNAGYKWLSEQLGIEKNYCHIGMFDVDMCKKVVAVCEQFIKENNQEQTL